MARDGFCRGESGLADGIGGVIGKTGSERKIPANLAIFYPQNHPQLFGNMELKSLFLLNGDGSGRIFKPLNPRSTLIFFEHIRFC